eukprot:GILK01003867.1.p1 GENE.GILK01003867.1~~GILK01003867.1.p1  ORF type:complete len:267 (+),score=40.56 GILK01003867.1:43-801(+)
MASSTKTVPLVATAMTPKQKADFVTQLIKFWNNYEGRDKFSKVLQYGSRFIAWYLLTSNPDMSKRFSGLMVGMRDARKLFRLFKSVNEYQKVMMTAMGKGDSFTKTMTIISRLGFLQYWIFDNLVILCNTKFLKQSPAQYTKLGSLGWFIGLVSAIILECVNLADSFDRESRLVKSQGTKTAEEVQLELKAIRDARTGTYLNIIKNLGDTITASNGIELPKMLVGKQFNEGLVGLGGLTSALITCYQLWPAN